MKVIKRSMAREYSREFSIRVHRGREGVVRKRFAAALRHLSNAQEEPDLAGILDALELGYAKDCIAVALRECEND